LAIKRHRVKPDVTKQQKQEVKAKKQKQEKVEKPEPVAAVEKEETYCFCKQVSYGQMIGCDNSKCTIEWFHFSCVGLQHKPKGKWFCSVCKSSKSVQRTHQPQRGRKRKDSDTDNV